MKLASNVIALGVLAAAMVIAPNLRYSISWDISVLALVSWIALAPHLMVRNPAQRTNAGWLASIGLSSATVALGSLAAIVGMYLSAISMPVVTVPSAISMETPAPEVVSAILGVQVQADLSSTKPALVITAVSPGSRADRLRLEEGDRLLSVNGTPVGNAESDPLALEAMRARQSADSVARAADSLKIGLERDRQLLDIGRQQLAVLENRKEALVGADQVEIGRAAMAAQAQAESVSVLDLRVNALESESARLSVAVSEIGSRQKQAFQVLEASGYEERRERDARLMITRLARELRKIDEGNIVQIGLQARDSLRTVDLARTDSGSLTYSALALAALIVGTALACGLSLASLQGVEKVAAVSAARSFESRHTAWQQQLTAAAAAATDEPTRKRLTEFSEVVRYAGRDPSDRGTPVNSQIDQIVQALSRSPMPSESELETLGGTLRAMIVQRENAIRAEMMSAAHGTR